MSTSKSYYSRAMQCFVLATLVACLLITSAALAAPRDTRQLQEFLSQAMGEPVTVKKTFEAPIGLTGVVVDTSRAKGIVLYVDENRTHFIVGMLFDARGNNLTTDYIQQEMPGQGMNQAMDMLMDVPTVSEGNSHAPEMYVISDPNCPYCAKLHELAERPMREGKVKINWVLTSSMGHDGKSEAVYTRELRSPGSGAAMLRDYYKGREDAAPEFDERGAKAVAKANQYFTDMGLKGTPLLMYRTRSGTVELYMGAPDQEQLDQIISVLAAE